MKIYIAGAGGMLGEAFYKIFSIDNELMCTDIDVNSPWLSYLDFRDYENYKAQVSDFSPDWLFHLGAHTDLEYCEKNSEDAYDTNTNSVKHAVKISNSLNIPVLYISTAGIFNGNKDYYDESDLPDPLGHYAKSKFLGEQHVSQFARDYLICRAGWMMGGGEGKDKKFVQKIISQIKSGVKTLNVVNDKFGTPTYTIDFAENVKKLIAADQRKLFNMVCEGFTSREDVLREILMIAGLDNEISVNVVNSDFFSREYFAERPLCERLVNRRLNDANLNIMRNWKVALSEYINNDYQFLINKK